MTSCRQKISQKCINVIHITFEHTLIHFITCQVCVSTLLLHSSLPIFCCYRGKDAVLHKCHMFELGTCARSTRRGICVMNTADAFHACVRSLHKRASVTQSVLCCPLVCKNIKQDFRISFILSKGVKL